MGKGARLRDSRKAGLDGPSLDALIVAATEAVSEAGFLEILAMHPEVLSVEARLRLEEWPAENSVHTERVRALLQGAASDPIAAWLAYRSDIQQAVQVADGLETVLEQVDEHGASGEHLEAINLIEQALPAARAAGLGVILKRLHFERGHHLLALRSEERHAAVERAIASFNAALYLSPDGGEAGEVLMRLGLAYTSRASGDPWDNLEIAVELQRQGLDQMTAGVAPELLAMARTNLAATLLRHGRGDRAEALDESARLSRLALEFRSPSRDGSDWAYSQINLAMALSASAGNDPAGRETARAEFRAVITQANHINERWLVGVAHFELGRSLFAESQPSAEQMYEASLSDDLDALFDSGDALEEAQAHLSAAVELVGGAPDQEVLGRALHQLARVQAELGASLEAFGNLRRARREFEVLGAQTRVMEVNETLAAMLAEAGRWEEAADAYRVAIQTSQLLFHSRSDGAGRQREVGRIGTLHRWAASAFARIGANEEAVRTLEDGRARELRRRMGADGTATPAIDELPPDAAAAYRATLEAVRVAPAGPAGDRAAQLLSGVLTSIRATEGFQRFAMDATLTQIARAVEPSRPLIYINPTPRGTLLATVAVSGSPRAFVRILDAVTSWDVYERLLGVDDEDAHGRTASYLFGISGHDTADFQADLDSALPWIGQLIARSVAEILDELGASGVTLVLCGPIGCVPVGAAEWQSSSGPVCLLDRFEIRYAPSALVAATAIDRAAGEKRPQRLLALGNPSGDLPAAEVEVQAARGLFPPGQAHCALGHRATSRYLRKHVRGATHIHFACHAAGGLFDGDDGRIVLADTDLTAAAILGIPFLRPRLVVISACESGQSEISGRPDEVVSAATAMLAAGAACCIATLWPVHDAATALLMTRFYEELSDGSTPPAALRAAQLWLRDLSPAGYCAFVDEHPDAHRALRDLPNDDPADPARRIPAAVGAGEEQMFRHPHFWAAFIALGA